MKRIIHDVPRWDIYLHRDARGIDPVDVADPLRVRFEDELFERLYAGTAEPLADTARDPALAPWAEGVHAACSELPAFGRLAGECRGDAAAAASAVETLMTELSPHFERRQLPEPRLLRTGLRKASDRASAALEGLRGAQEGLEGVAFGPMPGTGTGPKAPGTTSQARTLAQRLRHDPRLRRIAELAGRFKRIAARKLRDKVRHGVDELSDIEQGADLGRVLPAELARLRHPRLRLALLRDLLERRTLQYALRGTEDLGRGPLVVCLDKSGSMEGDPDIWATAVALALLELAHRQRRPFALLAFDSAVAYQAIVDVGQALPEASLFVRCSGGTDIHAAVTRALDIIASHPGPLRKADVVLVTDGASDPSHAPAFRARAAAAGITTLGIGIGITDETLAPWCDESRCITALDRLDDVTAEALFGR